MSVAALMIGPSQVHVELVFPKLIHLEFRMEFNLLCNILKEMSI